MGWAQRARLVDEEQPQHRYTVKRWTAFAWEYPEGRSKAVMAARTARRKHHTEQLESAAKLFEHALAKTISPDFDCSVSKVTVKREPQLLFSIDVVAPNEELAEQIAGHRIRRALSTKIAPNRNPPKVSIFGRRTQPLPAQVRTLTPVWGKTNVELVG
jgi:hypothetical protein